MNYLTLEDAENKFFVGVLQIVKSDNKAPIVHSTVHNAVDRYRTQFVDQGIAYGGLEQEIKESQENEYEGSGDPKELLNNLFQEQIMQYDQVDEIVPLDEAAFRVIDVDYDPERREILGRIQILDTQLGLEAQRRINNGMKPFISPGGIEGAVDPNDIKRGDLRPVYKVVKILPNYKLSFIKADETFRTLKYTELSETEVENPDEKFNEEINTNLDDDAREIIG